MYLFKYKPDRPASFFEKACKYSIKYLVLSLFSAKKIVIAIRPTSPIESERRLMQ